MSTASSTGGAAAGASTTVPTPVVLKRDRKHVSFELDTRISTIHVRGHGRAGAAAMADLINPVKWAGLPFFTAAHWIDQVPDETTQACSGLFYEHLEFHVGGSLLRSVENILDVTYEGWDPARARRTIRCWFNLHSACDDILAVDRGWYSATPVASAKDMVEDTSDGDWWLVEMKKHVRFTDPTNTALAPLLLASWQEALLSPARSSPDQEWVPDA